MNKIVLIDGNNLIFRSYYATAYRGTLMKNSMGFPTNALYGLINMINKIISEENPTHMMIAFDVGKTFRHEKYQDYKAGRSETPNELKEQLNLARDVVEAMGIKYYGIENYEADDIIGTFAKYVETIDNAEGIIVSSDKDLIQLISDKVHMKLLKSNDSIMMDKNKFKEIYGLDDPKRMIDIKSLMGDSSDNIPGVKGIGEKTALSLLEKYQTLDGVFEHLDDTSSSVKKKLIEGKENAYMSYELATIYTNVPININLDDIKYTGPNKLEYKNILNELEFYSILKKFEAGPIETQKDVSFKTITDLKELNLTEPYSIYLETLGYNYHDAKPLGVSICDTSGSYYIPFDVLKDSSIFMDNKQKYTYDLKKLYYVFYEYNIKINKKIDDMMLIAYLLNKNVKTDIAVLANTIGYDINFYDKLYGSEITIKMPENDNYIKDIVLKSIFIYKEYNNFYKELKSEEIDAFYKEIELPLTYVLVKMEKNGFKVDSDYFKNYGVELSIKIRELEEKIYEVAGQSFNILSTKQLGEVLFNKLGIEYQRKIKKVIQQVKKY